MCRYDVGPVEAQTSIRLTFAVTVVTAQITDGMVITNTAVLSNPIFLFSEGADVEITRPTASEEEEQPPYPNIDSARDFTRWQFLPLVRW